MHFFQGALHGAEQLGLPMQVRVLGQNYIVLEFKFT